MNSDATLPPRSHWPVNILAAMMFLVPAVGVPNEYMLQDTLKSAIAAFGILLAALAWTWDLQKNPRPLRWHWIVLLPLTLCLYALGSMVWSHTYLAGVEAVRWFLVTLLVLLGLNALSSNQWLRVLWATHWGAVVASLWLAGQFWWNFSLFSQGPSPGSTFFNRNFAAEYLITCLPLSVALMLQSATTWQRAFAASFLPAPLLLGILMTGTRSALAAIAIYSALLFGLLLYDRVIHGVWPRAWTKLQAAVCLTLVVLASQIPAQNPPGPSPWAFSDKRAHSIPREVRQSEGSLHVRLELWKTSLRMLQQHPFSGVGAGAWEVQAPRFQTVDTTLETDYYPHNEFLQLLCEYGLIVGGLVVAFLIAGLLQIITAKKHAPASGVMDTLWQRTLFSSLMGLGIVSLFGFPLRLAGGDVLIGLLLAGVFQNDRSATTMPHRQLIRTAAVLLTMGIGLAAWITVRSIQAESALGHALEDSAFLAKLPLEEEVQASELIQRIRNNTETGIRINPHYRKLTAMIAEVLMSRSQWEYSANILDSVVASRPYVPALLNGVALARAQLGEAAAADAAMAVLRSLRPLSSETLNTEIVVLANTRREQQARARILENFSGGHISDSIVQSAYQLGLKTEDWSLAVQAMELRARQWPQTSPDAYFRIGLIYFDPRVNQISEAVNAFRQGLMALPLDQHENYLHQVPATLQQVVKKGT